MNHYDQTIEDLCAEVAEQEEELIQTKRMVNRLCLKAGRTPVYSESELNSAENGSSSINADRFYGQPLATAVKDYLKMRKSSGLGAASVGEIYDALSRGGYAFDTKNDDNAKRGLRISLTKNVDFHKVAKSNTYGLTEWYPNVKQSADSPEPNESD